MLTGSAGAIDSVAFSPDGHTLADGSPTARSGSGTSPIPCTPGRSARPRPAAPRRGLGGVQPGRAHAGQRRLRRHRPAVGHHRSRAPPPARPDPDRRRHRRGLGGVQPRRAHAGQRRSDGTVRLWDVTDPARPGRSARPGPRAPKSRRWRSAPPGICWPAATTTARSGCGTSPIPPTSAAGRSPDGGGATVHSVAFSPDGQTLASGDSGGTVRLWDVTDPAHPRPLGQPLTGTGAAVNSVAFSPDGHTLASGERRRHGPALGCHRSRRSPPARPAPDRRQRRRGFGGVQPRWAHTGQRQRRRHHPALEPERPVRHQSDLRRGRRPYAPAVE